MSRINFFNEGIKFKLKKKKKIASWLDSIASEEGKQIDAINFIFCDDEYLLEVNKEYLNHNYYTDIITFDQNTSAKHLEGDIYISIDRVQDNSESLEIDFNTELMRVLAHGVLHLLGYKDKTKKDIAKIRAAENHHLDNLVFHVERSKKKK